MTPRPRNTESERAANARQSKVHSEQDSAPTPEEAGGLGVPCAAWGLPAECPASSKDGESPGLGPVGTSVRSSLQGGTALDRLRVVQGGQGVGQAYQDGDRTRWVWGAQGEVLENATMAGLEPPCPNHGLTKAGKGNREGAGG